jgi:probable rRNA maturation factor
MIEIINRQNRYWILQNRFRALLKQLIEFYKIDDPEVTLAFVRSTVIKKLNKDFLNKNTPTDVLSFPIGEKAADGKYYLGDIIISPAFAFEQCLTKQHGLERELEILTIHGFLHLLGFEHSKGLEEEDIKIRNLFLEEYHEY